MSAENPASPSGEERERRLLARIDALKSELDDIRDDVVELKRSRDTQEKVLISLSSRVEVLGAQVSAVMAELGRLSTKLGAGTAIGAGVPSLVIIIAETLRALGVLPH